jgi:hypothetical protein
MLWIVYGRSVDQACVHSPRNATDSSRGSPKFSLTGAKLMGRVFKTTVCPLVAQDLEE